MGDDDDDLQDRFARYVVSPKVLEDLQGGGEQSASIRRGGSPNRIGGRAVAERRSRMIVELNAGYPGGLDAARSAVMQSLVAFGVDDVRAMRAERVRSRYHVFIELSLAELEALPVGEGERFPIRKVWPDEALTALLDRSVRTIKADACLTAFGADGDGIVVAVADSGIEAHHPHFARYRNLDLPAGLTHVDMTEGDEAPLSDGFGHGTHIAGIVAGTMDGATSEVRRVRRVRDERGTVRTVVDEVADGRPLRGVAPKCKLLSLKVLDDAGEGHVSLLIAALERVEGFNEGGRELRVHCVNLSLGYPFDPEWYAAGHSPLCVTVNRLSRSGVVVVAAAGNDGSALQQTEGRSGRQRVGIGQSINDPGNAQEAITVGSTHGDSPHMYGVSHFSSRGPTADGRAKPDMVAPGERIVSCAAACSAKLADVLDEDWTPQEGVAYFREDSGTSMAAAHVSGAVASLLSIRREFIGRPEVVKDVLMGSCIDLKRNSDFQGAGLLDLMRAIQAV